MLIPRNMRVVWERVVSTDDRTNATYGDPIELRCHKTSRLRDVIDARGEVTTAAFQVMLDVKYEPHIGDLLDGREVIAVQDQRLPSGELVGRIYLTR